MYQVSNDFKNAIKSNTITTNAKLTFYDYYGEGEDLILTGSNLTDNALHISDYCCDDGKIIGIVASKELECEIINGNNYDLANKQFGLEVGVMIDRTNETYEYIPYGDFIVQSYQDTKSNNKYTLIANDLVIKTNVKLADCKKVFDKEFEIPVNPSTGTTFPTDLWTVYEALASTCGLAVENQKNSLPNTAFEVASPVWKTAYEVDRIIDGEETTVVEEVYLDYTLRELIGRCAELFGGFVKLNRENKLQIYLMTDTNETITGYEMNSTLEINDTYGPVNQVSIGLSNVEGENITVTEQILSADKYTMIRIDDNPFTYTYELRNQVIDSLFQKLNGFTYKSVYFKYKAYLYLDCGDKITVTDVSTGNTVVSMVLNQDIYLPKTRESTIDSPSLTENEQKYPYTAREQSALSRTEIVVDKANQQIKSIVSQIGDRSSKESSITVELNEIESRVEDIEDLTNETSGNDKITLENCMEGSLYELRILGNNSVFKHIYPEDYLFPSDNLYPHEGKSRIRVYTPNICPYKTEADWGNYTVNEQGERIQSNYHLINNTFMEIKPLEAIFFSIEGSYKINAITMYDNAYNFLDYTLVDAKEVRYAFANAVKYLLIDIVRDDGLEIQPSEVLNSKIMASYSINKLPYVEYSDEIYELNIDHTLLRSSNDYYDEFVIHDSNAYEIRRITRTYDENLEEIVDVINEEGVIVNERPFSIHLVKGTNYIEILDGYHAEIYAKWVTTNEFTDTFATQVQMYSVIEQTANSILLKVSEKVDEDEVIASINTAIEDHQGVIRISGNQIIINTVDDRFHLTKEGDIKATSGNIAGWLMTTNKFYRNDLLENYFVGRFDPLGREWDVMKAEQYENCWNGQILDLSSPIDGSADISLQEYFRLDYNNDGIVSSSDTTSIANNLQQKGTISINSNSLSKTLVFTNEKMNRETSIGAMGINSSTGYFSNLFCDNFALTKGYMLIGIRAGVYKRMFPVCSYDLDNTYQIDLNSNNFDKLILYQDNTERGYMEVFIRDGSGNYTTKSVHTISNDRPVTVLQDDGTNLIIQTGSSTYTISHNGSDERLKNEIKNTEIKNALQLINKIEHKSFDWKATGNHKKIGYIAQQLKEIDDSLIEEVKQPETSEITELYQLDMTSILALSTKAIQELSEENKQLKEKITSLEDRLNKIEKLMKGE